MPAGYATGRPGSRQDVRVTLPYAYQISQYDPADRDASGAYIGEIDSVSDEGPLEAAYLDAVEAFARELGVTQLEVRDAEVYDSPEDVDYGPDDTLVQVFGAGLVGLVDGAVVDIVAARLLVRGMLRGADKMLWCRLEAPEMTVHVGYDLYMFVATSRPCPAAVRATESSGLFPEDCLRSPYAPDEAEEDAWRPMHTPVDDTFWAHVDALVHEHGAVLLEESGAWTRWHRVTPDTPRPALRPRCLVWVWPDLTTDLAAVMSHLHTDDPDDIQGTVIWQAPDGRLHHASLNGDDLEEVRAYLAGATRALWRSDYVDDLYPLIEAVRPDGDDVIRARWEPLAAQRTPAR